MLAFSRLSLLEELRLCVVSRLGEVGEVFEALRGLASYELARAGRGEEEESGFCSSSVRSCSVPASLCSSVFVLLGGSARSAQEP